MFKQYRLFLAIFLTLTLLLLSGSTHLILAQEGQSTSEPAAQPTAEPTNPPTTEPTTQPTAEPTNPPTTEPTVQPTSESTVQPTTEPTTQPTAEPTNPPTTEPTVQPTSESTVQPTTEPTVQPTATVAPTVEVTPTVTVTPTTVVTESVSTAEEGVSAQLYSGTWQSGIGIKNLTTSNNTILVEFYNSSTVALQPYTYNTTLGSRAGVELYLPNLTSLSAGSYAARVTAGGAVGVSTTNTNYSTNMADSYNGMASSTQFFVPGIYNNFNSWVSELFIQNADSNAINAYIEVSGANLVSGASVGPVTFGPLNIPGNATRSFDTSSTSFNFDGQLGDNFLGSAKVTNSEGKPMAVVLFNTRVSGSNQVVLSYRGMTTAEDADTFLAAPVVYKNFGGGWRSGINVQNVDTSDPVDAKLTVKSQDGSLTATKTQTIQPGKSFEWFLPNVTFDGGVTLPDGFIGSAKVEVTDSGAGKIVGTVTTTNYNRAKLLNTSPAGVGVALGYIMPSRTSGKATLSAPTVYKQFGTGTWNSSLVVSNVGTSDATFSLTFASDSDSPATYNNTISGFSLSGGESKEFFLPNSTHLNGVTIPTGFKGSIFVQGSSGAQLAGIVQHTNYGRGVATVYLTPGN